jgi:CheY-like chemotaxis protein
MDSLKNLNILIVDDNRIKIFALSKILSEQGVDITTVFNGKKAVDLCSEKQFDVILMNILMPIMDGFEATREIRKFNKDVIIIAQTNYANLKERCIHEGFNDYIRYPFSKDELIGIILRNISEV